MENLARVVLALESPEVAEEVMHFLDRSGRARVVATAADDRQAADAVRQLEPDVVVAQPSIAVAGRAGVLFALDTRESIGSLRAAIEAGAQGFFLWPDDRERLSFAIGATLSARAASGKRGQVLSIRGARGGAGTTFVASHLAAAFSRDGRSCVLLEADPVMGDLALALGVPPEGVHNMTDVVALGDELAWHQMETALWSHSAGFLSLPAPSPDEAVLVGGGELIRVLDAAASGVDVVIVDLPRSIDDRATAALSASDHVLHVLTLDVLSFRAATRALEAFKPLRLDARSGFVVNRAARSEITPGDVRRAFDVDPLAVLPFDRAVERAQAAGRLLPARSRMGRSFDRLARKVLAQDEEVAA